MYQQVVLFLSGFVLLLVAQESLGDGGRVDVCDIACPLNFEPVCADCNGEMRNFTNSCSVRRENDCYKTNCQITSEGTCSSSCAIACTLEYDPKCSWNGRTFKTFGNPCFQKSYNICNKDKYKTIANCPCREPKGQV